VTDRLLQQLTGGHPEALEQLLERHRDYLRGLLRLRMDAELRSRIDPSDVIQETQLVVANRIDEFLDNRPTSFKLWLRGKALERLIDARRKHVVVRKRSVRREVSLPDGSSLALARFAGAECPSAYVRQQELIQQTNQAIAQLSAADREILLLRHVECLTNVQVAEVLGVSHNAASKRYGRALKRLRSQLLAVRRWRR